MNESPMLELLAEGNWGVFQREFDALGCWPFYPLLLSTLEKLDHSALFVSTLHGLGHIERTILQGGFCAMAEGLDETNTVLLLEACSYHDVGRQDDSEDPLHGHRSAQRIAALTGRTGEELKLLQGAVDAHSRRDKVLLDTIRGYQPADLERAVSLAQLLKDADGLDRVRIGDLDPSYLRRASSRSRVELAREVFNRYQLKIGLEPKPFFGEEIWAKIRAGGEKEGPETPKG